MTIPDYQTVMSPLMRLAGDKKEPSLRGAIDEPANEFNLTIEKRKELTHSGKQEVFDNRVGQRIKEISVDDII